MLSNRTRTRWLLSAAVTLLTIVPTAAQVVPERDAALAEKEYRHADLHIPNIYTPARQLPDALADSLSRDLAVLRVSQDGAFIDERSGRWGTLLPAMPLLPGDGKGNQLTWHALRGQAPQSDSELRETIWGTFRSYLESHEAQLQLNVDELASPARLGMSQRDLVQIHAPRVVDGVAVRDSFLTAVISHGNLTLLGARNWGDVNVSRTPTIDFESAWNVTLEHLSDVVVDDSWRPPHLALVPTARGGFLQTPVFGQGLAYRLVWVISPEIEDQLGRWEALIDAHSGELIAFVDQNEYATTRSVVGGVLPGSNDGTPPDGVEHPLWPMPFADITTGGGDEFVTDAGGNLLSCVDGPVTTELSGPFMHMSDDCGAVLENSSSNINLGTSGGTDCTVPPGSSSGNTHATRSGFYEMNRIKSQARAQLPDNTWLDEQLVSNMNIVSSCNAFWNGQVNFFRSGGGCGNTGELAAVFDHEWGHGMDDNDVNPTISNPGEGVADLYAAVRLSDSCLGRGFFLSGNCSGYGDPCVDCSGIRNIDFAERVSGVPHGVDFAISNCGNGPAPCGGITHCEGALYAEAVWDLFNRDLPSQGMEQNTAIELATRLTYIGAGPVGNWYNCDDGAGIADGCNADGGYLNYLAADDDNGDITDGTPHMTAISSAFARHDISCPFLTPIDSGCEGTPTEAPVLGAVAIDRGAQLNWDPVAGADRYEVFRTDGVFGCDFGKERVGETTETSFIDQNLANGREYYYTVAAMGSGATCMSPMSACTTVTPESGPNLAVPTDDFTLALVTGDGDQFIDNCEEATVSFDVLNVGSGSLSNVRIVDVRSPSHPKLDVTSILPLVISESLSACDTTLGTVDFIPQGLNFNDTLRLSVDLTGDEFNGGVRTVEFSLIRAESDFDDVVSRTFTLEQDTEGWQLEAGTFARTEEPGGGANGTDTYLASSSFVDSACDQIVSPLLVLSESSTMSLYTNFDIQPIHPQLSQWFDRANIGVTAADGERTPVSPDGGRLYNASGRNGTCDTEDQEGFGDAMTSWDESQWSAAALMAGDFAGQQVQLSVYYGTNATTTGEGFNFDEITLTDLMVQGEDQQSDSCEVSDAPTVSLTGSCPGTVTLTVDNGTPGGAVRIYRSASPGTTTVLGGQCAGLELELDNAQVVAVSTLDSNGEIVSVRPASGAQCGSYLQAVDVETCTPTDRVQIPQ